MNLPPVPGAAASTPPPASSRAQPALPAVPSSHLPPPPTLSAEAPLSRNAKRWLAGATLALVLGIVVAARFEPPSDSAVHSFVEKRLSAEGYYIENIFVTRQSADKKSATFYVTASVRRSNESRFVDVFADSGERGSLSISVAGGVAQRGVASPAELAPVDLVAWKRVRDQLAGPNGPQLRQAASLSDDDVALINATLVREIKEDARFPGGRGSIGTRPIDVMVRTARHGLSWEWQLEPGLLPHTEADRQRPLSAFKGKVLVLGRVADVDALRILAQRLPGIGERLERATAALFASQKTKWLELLKPAALLAGTAEPTAQFLQDKVRVVLEITEARADEDPPGFSALLRTDGSWKDTRLFAGRIVFDEPSGRFQLKLTAPPVEKDEDDKEAGRGPFLDDTEPFRLEADRDGDRVLALDLEDNALTWSSGRHRLRLEPVSDGARAALRAELEGNYPKLLEATKPGVAYFGTITNRAKGTRENYLLRFTGPGNKERDESEADSLEAVLEQPDRPAWKCALRGRIEPNRHRAKGFPVRLDRYDLDSSFSPPKEMTDIFEARGDKPKEDEDKMLLQLDGTKLAGENPRFVFRFERASSDFVAGLEKKWAAAIADTRRALVEAARPGAIYTGTVTGKGRRPEPENLLLSFAPREDSGEGVDAVFEHPAHADWKSRWRATVENINERAAEFRLRLDRVGGSVRSGASRRDSFFETFNSSATLRLEDGNLVGGNVNQEFRFAPAAPEFLAERQRATAASAARVLRIARADASYEGIITRAGHAPGRVRLHFLKIETNGATVEARLESVVRAEFHLRLAGSIDMSSQTLRLGRRPQEPGSRPLFEDPDLAPLALNAMPGDEVTLAIGERTIAGALVHGRSQGWELSFPLTP